MAKVSVTKTIRAPKDKVWEMVSEWGGTHKWIPGVGPVTVEDDNQQIPNELRGSLRAHLESQREFALVPDRAVQRRLEALGSRDQLDPLEVIRATRNLKARFYLTGRVSRQPRGEWQARIDVWETARERAVQVLEVQASNASALARQLSDSLAVALFEPQLQRSALR